MPARIWAVGLMIAMLLTVAGLVACGSTATGTDTERSSGAAGAGATTAASAPAQRSAAATAAPAATAAAQAMSERERVVNVGEESSGDGSAGFFQNAPLTDEAQTSIVPQNRVIVRTVDMGIIVLNVAGSTDEIVGMTRRYGGWVVSSDRSRKHQASLSVRVPAESLDEFVLALRQASDKVEYETSNSQDVTDEFVDNQARLNGLRSTEARLLVFLEQAVNIEEALNVQAELARIQLEMEEIQGRLRFLSETAAYSLVNLTMTTKPGEMTVEIGEDGTFRAGLHNVFRATFRPPEGVDEFKFTWDFGDGSPLVEGTQTAPTTSAGERVTATVSHAYTNVEQSPYIVQMNISGIGDAGLFLGTDTLIATVTAIPGIEVFAGEDRVVDEGDEMEYSGSFTRPESLWNFRYRWDFGDGSATIFEVPEEGETRAVALHTFPDYRPDPYGVVLTVIAQSEAGEIRGSSTFTVRVNDVKGFIVAGWDIGNTTRSAIRALSVIGQVLLTILIWVGVFSPVWLAVLAAIILFTRLKRRFGWGLEDRTISAPWQSSRSDAGGGTVTAGGPPPPAEPVVEPAAGPVADREESPEEGSPAPEVQEEPSNPCAQCGRDIPATDIHGRPPQYCPHCGAESPSPDVEGEPQPNA